MHLLLETVLRSLQNKAHSSPLRLNCLIGQILICKCVFVLLAAVSGDLAGSPAQVADQLRVILNLRVRVDPASAGLALLRLQSGQVLSDCVERGGEDSEGAIFGWGSGGVSEYLGGSSILMGGNDGLIGGDDLLLIFLNRLRQALDERMRIRLFLQCLFALLLWDHYSMFLIIGWDHMPKMMLRSLLKILSFSIFSMSLRVRLQQERSSHCRSLSPSRISVTTSVVISLATTLRRLSLVQFLQMARKPSLVMPVAPMKSSSMSLRKRPIMLPPFCLSCVLAMCSTFSSLAFLWRLSMHLKVSLLQETYSCSRYRLLKNICSSPSSLMWLSIRYRIRSRCVKYFEMLNSLSSFISQLFSYRCTRFGKVFRKRVRIASSITVKLCFRILTVEQMLDRESSIQSCYLDSLWLLMSRVIGLGTSSRISGNSLSSIYLRQKHSDLPLEPMMPFLMSISSFNFFSFCSAINFSRSSRSFFCSHACSSSVSPQIFSQSSEILITLSLISFLLFSSQLSFMCSIFFDCMTSPSRAMRSSATQLEAWYRLQKESSWCESSCTLSALYLFRCREIELSMSLMTTAIIERTSATTPAQSSLVVPLYHLYPSPFSMMRPSRRLMISASLMISSSILLGSFLIALVSDFLMSFQVSSMMNLLDLRQLVSSVSMRFLDSVAKALILSLMGWVRVSKSAQICLMTDSCRNFSLMSTSLSLSTLLQEWISARFDSSYMNCAGWMSRCSRRHFSQISRLAHFEQQHMNSHGFLWISHYEFISYLGICYTQYTASRTACPQIQLQTGTTV